MGGSLKEEQQDSDGQEERVQPSPLTSEEWDGPSKTAVQSCLNSLSISYIGNTLFRQSTSDIILTISNFTTTFQQAVIRVLIHCLLNSVGERYI